MIFTWLLFGLILHGFEFFFGVASKKEDCGWHKLNPMKAIIVFYRMENEMKNKKGKSAG